MPTYVWEFPEDSDEEPCPEGCGRVTDDPYGGPCSACWDDIREEAR